MITLGNISKDAKLKLGIKKKNDKPMIISMTTLTSDKRREFSNPMYSSVL